MEKACLSVQTVLRVVVVAPPSTSGGPVAPHARQFEHLKLEKAKTGYYALDGIVCFEMIF